MKNGGDCGGMEGWQTSKRMNDYLRLQKTGRHAGLPIRMLNDCLHLRKIGRRLGLPIRMLNFSHLFGVDYSL
jgi:hypothetical protein